MVEYDSFSEKMFKKYKNIYFFHLKIIFTLLYLKKQTNKRELQDEAFCGTIAEERKKAKSGSSSTRRKIAFKGLKPQYKKMEYMQGRKKHNWNIKIKQ